MSEHKELESGEMMDHDLCDGSDAKICVDCGTSKTPLWRSGPAGPKSLCNACGIRSRKKRRATVPSQNRGSSEEKKKKMKKTAAMNNCRKNVKSGDDPIERRSTLLAMGSTRVSLKRSSRSPAATNSTTPTATVAAAKLRRKLGEVEQAAVLLMALSCGSVYG